MQMADGLANHQVKQHLYTPVGSNKLVLCVSAPQAKSRKVRKQVLIDNGKFSRQHAANIDIACVRLKALVVAQDLRTAQLILGHIPYDTACL